MGRARSRAIRRSRSPPPRLGPQHRPSLASFPEAQTVLLASCLAFLRCFLPEQLLEPHGATRDGDGYELLAGNEPSDDDLPKFRDESDLCGLREAEASATENETGEPVLGDLVGLLVEVLVRGAL